MKFITYATHSERYYPALIASYEKFGANYVVLGFGDEWKDYLQKMNAILDFLRTGCHPDEVVCIMDGFDSILTGSPNEMEEEFKKTGAELIFSRTEVLKMFYSLNWKNKSYLNAGLYIGYAKAIIFLIDKIMETHTHGFFNDQRLFGKWMVKNKNSHFRVDKENQFFLNVVSHKPMLSIFKSKRPFAVGGPAYADLQPYIDNVGIPFRSLQYENGQHTLWNRLVQGEFNEECQCVVPIAITVLLILTVLTTPFIAVYYGNIKK